VVARTRQLERQTIAAQRRVQRERQRLLRLLNDHALDEETVEIEIDAEDFDDYGALDEFGDYPPED
jgi:hypothetical protein